MKTFHEEYNRQMNNTIRFTTNSGQLMGVRNTVIDGYMSKYFDHLTEEETEILDQYEKFIGRKLMTVNEIIAFVKTLKETQKEVS